MKSGRQEAAERKGGTERERVLIVGSGRESRVHEARWAEERVAGDVQVLMVLRLSSRSKKVQRTSKDGGVETSLST